jgi:hypothetical protein
MTLFATPTNPARVAAAGGGRAEELARQLQRALRDNAKLREALEGARSERREASAEARAANERAESAAADANALREQQRAAAGSGRQRAAVGAGGEGSEGDEVLRAALADREALLGEARERVARKEELAEQQRLRADRLAAKARARPHARRWAGAEGGGV